MKRQNSNGGVARVPRSCGHAEGEFEPRTSFGDLRQRAERGTARCAAQGRHGRSCMNALICVPAHKMRRSSSHSLHPRVVAPPASDHACPQHSRAASRAPGLRGGGFARRAPAPADGTHPLVRNDTAECRPEDSRNPGRPEGYPEIQWLKTKDRAQESWVQQAGTSRSWIGIQVESLSKLCSVALLAICLTNFGLCKIQK